MLTLYDYFRSSASFRVRIALNIKNVDYQLKEVHLVNNGGEQHQDDYKNLNCLLFVHLFVCYNLKHLSYTTQLR